ncbi:MAG TPA: hypothetical protein VN429_10940 [Methanospirillum sp.]|uniref:hypothetical protein n=1 Tax=Methanospirillum sp. TaxID=45200 RepID=UPI002CCEC953|nr:hypothetical protein [Methanospirillum sp.]HWQ64922.1 hypothetical protein [Methanospirillum sp.]
MKQVFTGLFICGFLLLIQIVSAVPGDIIWQQTLGGQAGEEWGYSVDTTSDNGMIITGIAYSEDANISGAKGQGDLWVVRLGPDGKPLWNHAYGGNGSDYGLSVKTIPDGSFIIVGTTGSTNGDVSGYHDNGDLWVIKLSSSGEPVWKHVYGGNMTDEGGDIIQTPDGGYMLVGYTMSNDGDVTGHHGGGDLWMLHLNQTGSIVWQKTFGGSKRDSGSSIIRTSDGGYAMTGNTYSSDGDVTSNHGSSDLWVMKTDANGTLLWQKSYGGSKLDWGHSLIELPGGDLLVAGVTASSDGDVHLNHGAGDIWVLRLSSQGNLIWEKTYGGNFSDNVWKIEPSPRGGAFLVGETFSVDGDILGNHGDADLWTSEIDGNGTILWQRTLGGSNYDSGSWGRLMQDGNLSVVGTTRSSDGDVRGIIGNGDLWAVKISTGNVSTNEPVQTASVNTSNVSAGNGTVPLIATNVTQPPLPQLVNNTTSTSVLNVTTSPVIPSVPVNSSENKTLVIPPTVINQTPGNATANTNQTNTSNSTLVAIPGFVQIPGDPNHDGKYEDLNGNGKIDLQDPPILFNNFDWIKANLPNQAFDFNGNGVLDYGDITALFEEASR